MGRDRQGGAEGPRRVSKTLAGVEWLRTRQGAPSGGEQVKPSAVTDLLLLAKGEEHYCRL